MKNQELLNQILKNKAHTHKVDAKILNTVCVFDLDSTLFNVSTRTEKIIHEFAEMENFQALKNIHVQSHHWGLKEALLDSDISVNWSDPEQALFFEKLKESWKTKFFSNEYLHYDVPYLGAVHFLQTLDDHNIPVFYLTGRDQHRMGKDTSVVLKKWGFPLQDENRLILKEHRDLIDKNYKLEKILFIQNQHPYAHIYFFENEPVIINHVGQKCPEIKIVYMNTTHSREQTVNTPVLQIDHFE